MTHQHDPLIPADRGAQRFSWLSSIRQPVGLGAIALILALLGVASGSIFFVWAEQDMTPNAIAFNRLWIAAIAFASWNGLQAWRSKPATPPTTLPTIPGVPPNQIQTLTLLAAAGTSFAAFLITLAWALTQTTVANAALFTHLMPIFTTLISWFWLGKRFGTQFLIGLAIAIAGVVAIGIDDFALTNRHWLGDAAALLAALLLAIEILIVEHLRTQLATPIITMSECTVGSILLLPMVWLSGTALFPSSWQSALPILGLALVTQMLGHGLLTYSLKQFSAELIAIALLSVPIIAALLALIFFSQTISLPNAIAFAIVLVGIYFAITAPKTETVADPVLKI